MSNFKEYLISLGKLNASKEEKEELRKKYRKDYHKRYNQKRKTNSKLLQIWVEKPVFTALSSDAKELGLSAGEFVRNLIKAYKENSYILPDEEVMYDLIVCLSQLSTNLQEIAYLCNTEKEVNYEQIQEVKRIFLRIEEMTLAHFRPLNLEDYIKNEVSKNPRFISHLERIIEDYKRMGL